MKTPTILVTRCYSEMTPDSAEHGEESDSGFVFENEPMTFRQLVSEMRNNGFFREGETDWLAKEPWVESYATATWRSESLHFSRLNPPRLAKWFWLAAKFAS